MTDTTQNLPDDASLFSDATTTTLEKFENAEPLPPPKPPEPPPPVEAKTGEPKPGEPPPKEADAPVPAGRLREEAEARRKAERERDDLMRQIASLRQPPQQPPPPKPDVFENPSGFVQSEVKPYFEQIAAQMRMQTETFSEQMAGSSFGFDKVAAAKQALTAGMQRGDPDVRAVWQRAMDSAHPYDVITRWHLNNENLREVGPDIAAYKKRILEEAETDPEHQRQAIERHRTGGNAQHVARPVTSSVPKIPSLGNVGAGAGGEADLQEPSDEQLFRAATSAKRR